MGIGDSFVIGAYPAADKDQIKKAGCSAHAGAAHCRRSGIVKDHFKIATRAIRVSSLTSEVRVWRIA